MCCKQSCLSVLEISLCLCVWCGVVCVMCVLCVCVWGGVCVCVCVGVCEGEEKGVCVCVM